jgi:hypothetical protein
LKIFETIRRQNQSRSTADTTADTAAAAFTAGATVDSTGGIAPFLGRSGVILEKTWHILAMMTLSFLPLYGICFTICD